MLQPFLDLLLEVPLYDWWPLRDDWTWLPDFGGVQRLGAMRTARLASWTISASFGSGAAAADLANLAGTTRAAFEPLFQSSVSVGVSLAATQQAAFSVFSLPDIVALASEHSPNQRGSPARAHGKRDRLSVRNADRTAALGPVRMGVAGARRHAAAARLHAMADPGGPR